MPHPLANIARANSLEDAKAHLETARTTGSDKSISWTILKFDEHPEYFVFHSSRSLSQQAYADVDRETPAIPRVRAPGAGLKGEALATAQGQHQAFLNQINDRRQQVADGADARVVDRMEAPYRLDGGLWDHIPNHKVWIDTRDDTTGHPAIPWGGHAEEHMLQFFVGLQETDGKNSRNVTIWNADTPCMPGDQNCSKNLSGFPDSCCSKLDHLAEAYGELQFTVKVGRSLARGAMQGVTLGNAIVSLNGRQTEKPDNLTYAAFDDDEISTLLPPR